MNLTHLGDSLDHWKGSVIQRIGGANLQVVPMFTDPKPWTQENLEAYARLLRRESNDILKKERVFTTASRGDYFRDLGECDLFLDPDTGIAPDGKTQKKHITPSEIACLLAVSSSRLLLIYQHASRKKNGVKEKLKSLRSTEGLRDCHVLAYDSGAVSMVVISRNRERVDKVSAQFRSWLGPVATDRIIE